jgi:hypothetical protein
MIGRMFCPLPPPLGTGGMEDPCVTSLRWGLLKMKQQGLLPASALQAAAAAAAAAGTASSPPSAAGKGKAKAKAKGRVGGAIGAVSADEWALQVTATCAANVFGSSLPRAAAAASTSTSTSNSTSTLKDDGSSLLCLHYYMALCSHSCLPNCDWLHVEPPLGSPIGTRPAIVARALVDIAPGAEVTIPYFFKVPPPLLCFH